MERTIDHVPESEYEPPVPEIPMDDPDDMLSESGEQNPDELPALYDGAVVMVRISKTPLLPDGEMWVAMGAQDRVQVDESAQSASERISDFVVSELEYVTDKALATHQEAERQRAAERAEALRQPRSRVRRS